MASEKVQRTVAHKKLYLSVGGKLTHVPAGTVIDVTKEQADKLGKKLSSTADVGKVEIDSAKKTEPAKKAEPKAATAPAPTE